MRVILLLACGVMVGLILGMCFSHQLLGTDWPTMRERLWWQAGALIAMTLTMLWAKYRQFL